MDAGQQAGGRLSFGVFEVDLRAGELRKHGLRVRLQQQPFQVLAMLLARPGDVVTREELQRTLWSADTFVDFDHGLNKAINKVREALGDSADTPRFVETVARRGYRFLADVRMADAGTAPTDPSAVVISGPPVTPVDAHTEPTGSRADSQVAAAARPRTISASLAVVALVSLAFWRLHSPADARPAIRSLAVLPLESLSSDQSQDYFADGMTD